MKENFSIYLEQILGLKEEGETGEQFSGVMDLLIKIRKDAKSKKDFLTSDTIRKQLAELGIEMKDEKDGKISWSRK
jgi:cysteinyl-tRNA synthetase